MKKLLIIILLFFSSICLALPDSTYNNISMPSYSSTRKIDIRSCSFGCGHDCSCWVYLGAGIYYHTNTTRCPHHTYNPDHDPHATPIGGPTLGLVIFLMILWSYIYYIKLKHYK